MGSGQANLFVLYNLIEILLLIYGLEVHFWGQK